MPTCSATLLASDRAAWLFEVSFAIVVVWMTPMTAMSGATARVTRASCHAAVNPTTNPDTNVAK